MSGVHLGFREALGGPALGLGELVLQLFSLELWPVRQRLFMRPSLIFFCTRTLETCTTVPILQFDVWGICAQAQPSASASLRASSSPWSSGPSANAC